MFSISMNHTSTHPVSQSVTKASSMTSQSVISHHIYDTVTSKHYPHLLSFLLFCYHCSCPGAPASLLAPSSSSQVFSSRPPRPASSPSPPSSQNGLPVCRILPFMQEKRNSKKMHVCLPFVQKEIQEG